MSMLSSVLGLRPQQPLSLFQIAAGLQEPPAPAGARVVRFDEPMEPPVVAKVLTRYPGFPEGTSIRTVRCLVRVMRYLADNPGSTGWQIAEGIHIARATAAQHIQALAHMGLCHSSFLKKVAHYSLTDVGQLALAANEGVVK